MRTINLTLFWAAGSFCALLLLFGCKSRQTTPPPVTDQPTQRPPTRPDFDDDIPMITADDGVVNGPGRETTYAPTRYVDLPVQQQRPGNMRPAASNQCNFVGEVWDFVGENGCSQVVETNTGYLLSVTGVPPGYFLEGGSRIRFGFNYAAGTPDECTQVDGSIRITCMQLIRSASGFPRPIVCESHDQPSQWIHELIQDLGATYVTRFPWDGDRLVYLFETPSGQYLYDCRGFILCQPPRNCLQFIEDFNAGTQIYEG